MPTHHEGADRPTSTGERRLVVEDPATGSSHPPVVVADDAEVERAVRTAVKAATGWRRVPAAERAAALHRVADSIRSRRDHLADLATSEMGRPIGASRDGVAAAVEAARQYAELGPVRRGHSLLGGWDALDLVLPEPRGVVAAVTPWNDPVAVPVGIVAAALVSGNVVVVKPSERTPHTGRALVDLIAAELPPGVLIGLDGDASTGAALAAQTGVDVVVHVGSTAAGASIRAAAARTGAKVVLENGGNDVLLVDATVDPEWAATQAALGAFTNAGQLCTAVERIYVVEDVAGEVVERLVRQAERIVVGDPREPATGMGPLVDRRMRDAVHEQVSAARADGARLLTGGQVPTGPGAYYPPTVLTDCRDSMRVVSEETFGPVAPVVVVRDVDEAIARANQGSYGLAATVLTADLAVAQRAARELDVGTVKVNAVFGGAPGGSAEPRRSSGTGLGYGPELLDELTVRKVVHLGRAVV